RRHRHRAAGDRLAGVHRRRGAAGARRGPDPVQPAPRTAGRRAGGPAGGTHHAAGRAVGLRRATAGGTVLLAVLTGCGGGSSDGPPTVTVATGSQTVTVKPTQYCLDGDGQRYDATPPVIEVSPDSPITF